MKKVLIIAYYFPPVGGGGVQRTLKFTKNLIRFDWKPVVLTVKDYVYRKTNREMDDTLLREIPKGINLVRTPSIDFKNISSYMKTSELSNSYIANIKSALRKISAIFINPDAQMFWIPIAFKVGYKLIKKHNIDVLYSTANPWSDHIIGALLSKAAQIPWIADYRDAWNLHPYVTESSFIRNKIQIFLERKVIQWANRVIFTTDLTKRNYAQFFGGYQKYVTIHNAFDPDDFASKKTGGTKKFTILYSGNIWPYTRPTLFIYAISQWIKQNPEIKNNIIINILGRSDFQTKELIHKLNLSDIVKLYGYLPHHMCVTHLLNSDVLLLTLDEGGDAVIPGKIFEYLAAGKEVLATIPINGIAADILRKTGRDKHIVNPRDIKAIRHHVGILYKKYKDGCLSRYSVDGLEEYTWIKATEKLSKLLHELSI